MVILELPADFISGTHNQKMVSNTVLGHANGEIDNPFIIDI
jgi:hypothetical protein